MVYNRNSRLQWRQQDANHVDNNIITNSMQGHVSKKCEIDFNLKELI